MYTLKNIEEMFGFSERTLRRYLSKGILKGTKEGTTWKFSDEDVSEFLQTQEFDARVKKNKFIQLFDFANGNGVKEDTVLLMFYKEKLSMKQSKDISLFMKNLDYGFQFNMTKNSRGHLIQFIGHEDDGVRLKKFVNEL